MRDALKIHHLHWNQYAVNSEQEKHMIGQAMMSKMDKKKLNLLTISGKKELT